jgi:hypothetical protein
VLALISDAPTRAIQTSDERRVTNMKNSNTLSGVGVVGMSWTFHVAGTAAPAAYSAIRTLDAIPQAKRHAAAAAVASVSRGPS